MVSLIDFSFLLIAIAILGFIAKDAFYFKRKFFIPYEIRDETEKLFSNISLGLVILSVCWMFIITFIISVPDLANTYIQPIFDALQKMIQMGVIPQTTYNDIISNFVLYGFLFYILSFLFIVLIFISLVAGIVATVLDYNAINVYFVGATPKPFRRIIKESGDFLYLESIENFRKWTAIKKVDIIKIENTVIKPKFKSQFDAFLRKHCSTFCEKHPWIGNERYRRALIIGLLIAVLIISLIPRFKEYVIIRIIMVIIFIPIIILLLIQSAFEPE